MNALLDEHFGISHETLLERKKKVLMPCLYHFYGDQPFVPVSGKGVYLTGSDGKQYLDLFSGVAVNSLGHCHPEVVEAASLQMNKLQHTTSIYLCEEVIELAEKLVKVSPNDLSRVFFCVDGSGANEGAMIAARIATGRSDFLAFESGLHGRTSLTMSATGLNMWKADPFLPSCVTHLPHPSQMDLEEHFKTLRSIIESHGPDNFAAMIAEPICGNGGIRVPPSGYFNSLKSLLNEYGILLIADEVQTGFCRTGEWFGIDHDAVSPDFMSVAKAFGNGLPIAAWMATEEVAERLTSPQASTFGGNLVSVAAALKVIEIMEREKLHQRSKWLGEKLLRELEKIQSPFIHEIRGKGLMIGIEIRSVNEKPDGAICDQVMESLKSKGILVGKTGVSRNVLTLEPPLIIEEHKLMNAVSALDDSLKEILK